jgi:hypothetical protein
MMIIGVDYHPSFQTKIEPREDETTVERPFFLLFRCVQFDKKMMGSLIFCVVSTQKSRNSL